MAIEYILGNTGCLAEGIFRSAGPFKTIAKLRMSSTILEAIAAPITSCAANSPSFVPEAPAATLMALVRSKSGTGVSDKKQEGNKT